MNEPRWQSTLRWIARGASALIVGVILMIAVGEGGFNPLQLNWNEAVLMTAFWIAIAGLVVAWWSDWLGGSLAVGGMLVFYIGHRWTAGAWPAGWAFPLVAFVGSLVLMVACFRPERAKSEKSFRGSPS
jgi:hypothetical protein